MQVQIPIHLNPFYSGKYKTGSFLTLTLPFCFRSLILTIRVRVRLARILRLAFGIAFVVAGFCNFGGACAGAFGGRGEAGDTAGFEGLHLAC